MSHPPLNFTRRAHRPGDEQLLFDLLRASFETWPKVEIQCDPIEHLRWKTNTPPNAIDIHRITEVDGRFASSVFCWVQNVKIGDQAYKNIQGVDRVVHPDFQRLGLGDQIARWRREHPEDQPCDLQFGPRSGHPAHVVMQEQAQQAGRAVTLGNRIRVLTLANDGSYVPPHRDRRDEALAPSARAQTQPCDIKAVECFDDRIDGFWQRASAPYHLILERKRDYMNWRYADKRAGIFAIHLAEHEGELLGYSTLRISHDRGYIADLLVLPERLEIAAALLDDANAHLASTHVSRIDWWLPAMHPYQALAREAGFVDKRIVDIDLFPHNPNLDLALLTDPSMPVHFAAGDSDLV